MQNDIYIIGEVGFEVTLASVITSVEASDQSKPLNVFIHSPGGSVFDGLAIYNYLKGLDQEVHTNTAGLVASVASVFFLAGEKSTRKINNTDNFLIHLPSNWGGGNAEDLQKAADQLREMENKFAQIYEDETDLTKEEALELMKKDDFLKPEFLLEKGFVSEIVKIKAVANFNKNPNNMNTLSDKDKGFFTKFFDKIEALVSGPVAKLVTDAAGTQLEFKDVDDDATPQIGDKATVDGKPAEGEYTMPNKEVWKFEKSELMEKVAPSSDDDEDDDALKDAKEEVVALKTKVDDLEKDAKKNEKTIAKLGKQFNKMRASMGSEFEYVGKTSGDGDGDDTEPATRSFHGPKWKDPAEA